MSRYKESETARVASLLLENSADVGEACESLLCTTGDIQRQQQYNLYYNDNSNKTAYNHAFVAAISTNLTQSALDARLISPSCQFRLCRPSVVEGRRKKKAPSRQAVIFHEILRADFRRLFPRAELEFGHARAAPDKSCK